MNKGVTHGGPKRGPRVYASDEIDKILSILTENFKHEWYLEVGKFGTFLVVKTITDKPLIKRKL